jgi:hypothetical protein
VPLRASTGVTPRIVQRHRQRKLRGTAISVVFGVQLAHSRLTLLQVDAQS